MQQKGAPKQIKNYIYFSQNKLGKGSFSIVYLGQNITNNQTVAIKVIDAKSIKTDIERVLVGHQMKALKLMSHQNVIKVNEIYQTANNIYIVCEYCQLGDLQHYIKSKNRLSEEQALHILGQLLSGVIHIHSKGVIHRDLKSQNILIKNHSKDKIFKIIDFGFCQVGDTKIQQPYNVGSPLYMSPEAFKKNRYSTKSDSWALGMILLQMLLGDLPFRGMEYDLLIQQLANGEPYKNLKCSQLVKVLLSKLLAVDYQRRIDATEAYNMIMSNKIQLNKILSTNNPSIANIQSNIGSTTNLDSNKSFMKPKVEFATNQRDIRGSMVNQSPAPKPKPRDISPARPLDKALAYLKPRQPSNPIQDQSSFNHNHAVYKLKICENFYSFLICFQESKSVFTHSQRILLLGLKLIKQYLQSVTILLQQDARTLSQQQQQQLCTQIYRFNDIQGRYNQNTLFSDLYFSFAIEYLKLQYQYFNYLQFWIKFSLTEIKKKIETGQKQYTPSLSKSYLYLLKINEFLDHLKKSPIYTRTDALPQNKILNLMIADKNPTTWTNIQEYQTNHQKLISK